MNSFFAKEDGSPKAEIEITNPICAEIRKKNRKLCKRSHARILSKIGDEDYVPDICDAGFWKGFVPFRDEDGKLVGALRVWCPSSDLKNPRLARGVHSTLHSVPSLVSFNFTPSF